MNNLTKEFRFDLNQLHKMTVGFDRLFDQMLLAGEYPNTVSTGYPPYNVERIDDGRWRVTIAVAGFSQGDLSVTVDNGQLTVSGHKEDSEKQTWLHKGIATRDFSRSWNLAEFVEVESAECKAGMLEIHLKQEVPEALKPKTIEIKF